VTKTRVRPPPSEAPGPINESTCDPVTCPCTVGTCTLSRVARAVAGENGRANGQHSLSAKERTISERLASMSLDMGAMAAVSNIYRAAGSIRNHFERSVLAPHDLTWTGWVVLWVVWIWDDIEARHVAAEAGISKGTLTGVASTLERRGLLTRRTHPDDARRVLISLTPAGRRIMVELFPLFNAQETHVVAPLSAREVQVLTTALRKMIMGLEREPPPRQEG
jgi:DNA-binding MarR family transcriptional regulator